MTDQPHSPEPRDPSAGQALPAAETGQRRLLKIGSQRDQPPRAASDVIATPSSDETMTGATNPEPGSLPDRYPESPPLLDAREVDSATKDVTEPMPSAALNAGAIPATGHPFPPTRLDHLSDELRREIDEALGDSSMEKLLAGAAGQARRGPEPEIDQRCRAVVVKVHRDDVFMALAGGFDGVLPLRQLAERPHPGDTLDVVVGGFNREDGLYLLRTTGGAIPVADWSDLEEGLIVDVRVTGHNAGGLECEVQQIPGFIPIGQVSLYRVEDLSEFVGQRFACVVTEANPRRGNLVLSRRAVLEREREAARKQLLESIQPGQVREGVIRSLRDFGAFVDLDGIDGLIHISKLSWDPITHPSEVVEIGQRVRVRVERVDPNTGKIGLSYRDMVHDPWEQVHQRLHEGAIVQGLVTKLADFGAFVRLEAGIEGLIHISELAHHRVTRVDTVVQLGQEVTVKILSIDPDSQRISLSRKAAITASQQAAREVLAVETEEPANEAAAATPPAPAARSAPLRGGTDRRTGGEQFGLNW